MAMHEHTMKEILGKTVKAIVYDETTHYETRQRFFLVFTDGSYLQIFGEDVHCADGISWGGEDAEWYNKRYNMTARVIGKLTK